jgi:hypothetical protein
MCVGDMLQGHQWALVESGGIVAQVGSSSWARASDVRCELLPVLFTQGSSESPEAFVVGWGACPTVEGLRLEVGKSESPSIMGSRSSQSNEWGAVSLGGHSH